MTIASWPINDRPREKLLIHGAASLSDTELLAIFIRCGTKGKTAVDIARSLLGKFGDLRSFLETDQKETCKLPGFSKTKYAVLQAALELSKRYLEATIKQQDFVTNAEKAYLYLTSKLRNYEQEIFGCLFLNNQNRVICYEEIARGSINDTTIYPREIIKKALHHNAAAIILAHNHTSEASTPSAPDKKLTYELIKILRLIDVKVLDHIVISNNGYTSLAKQGLILA